MSCQVSLRSWKLIAAAFLLMWVCIASISLATLDYAWAADAGAQSGAAASEVDDEGTERNDSSAAEAAGYQGVSDGSRVAQLEQDGLVWKGLSPHVAAVSGRALGAQGVATAATASRGDVDIVFVIDTTGSMYDEINLVKSNLAIFAKKLKDESLSARFSLIEFRDIEVDGTDSTIVHAFSGSNWTTSDTVLSTRLASLDVDGGGDIPETPTDAFAKTFTSSYGWRDSAEKYVFLVTDAGYKSSSDDSRIMDMSDAIKEFNKRGIHVSFIGSTSCYSYYTDLTTKTAGTLMNLYDSNFGKEFFTWAATISTKTDSTSIVDYAKLSSVLLNYNNGGYDKNLLKDVQTLNVANKNTPIELKPTFQYANNNRGKVQLVQIAKDKTEKVLGTVSAGNAKSCIFKGLTIGSFEVDSTVVVDVYGIDGARKSRSKLSLSISDKEFPLKELDFSDGLKFKVNTGLFTGMSLELGDIKCPITVSCDSDGKIQVGFNFDIGDKKILEQLKKGATFGTSAKDLRAALKHKDLVEKFGNSTPDFKPSFNVIGYAEGALGSSVVKGKLTFEVGASSYREQQFAVFTVPVVVEVSFSVKGSASGMGSVDLGATTASKAFKDGAIDLGAEGSLGLYAGVGAAYLASAGVFGKAGVSYKHRLLPRAQAGPLDLTVKGTVGLKVKVLGCDVGSLNLFEGEYPVYRRDSSYSPSAVVQAATGVMSLDMSKVYPLLQGGAPREVTMEGMNFNRSLVATSAQAGSHGLTGVSLKSAVSSTALGGTVFHSNAYPDASPVIVSSGDTTAMFYLDRSGDRESANDPVLKYSIMSDVWDGEVFWSERGALLGYDEGDDGTADLAFDVFAAPDGFDVVWQNATRAFTGSETLEERAKATDIMYVHVSRDGEVGNPVRVTSGGSVLEMAPRVASTGQDGQVCVAWIENSKNALDFSTGANSIVTATWDASASTPSISRSRETVSGVPTNIDAGLVGELLKVAYSYDVDGDLTNADDSHVAVFGDADVEAPDGAANPQFVKWNGDSTAVYYRGGGLYDLLNSNAEIMPEGTLQSSSYSFVWDDSGKSSIVQSYCENERTTGSVRTYDSEKASWSDPYSCIDVEGTAQAMTGAYVPSGGLVLATEVRRDLANGEEDSSGDGEEASPGDDANAQYVIAVSNTEKAMLSVTGVQVGELLDSSADSVALRVTVRNEGQGVADTDVNIYRETWDDYEESYSGGSLISSFSVEGLAPGKEQTYSVSADLPYYYSDREAMRYVAVPYGEDYESSRTDDSAVELYGGNTAVSVVEHTVEGTDETLVIRVSNEGITAGGEEAVEVFNWDTNETVATLSTSTGSNPGDSSELEYRPGGLLRSSVGENVGVRVAWDKNHGSVPQASDGDDFDVVQAWTGGEVGQTFESGDAAKLDLSTAKVSVADQVYTSTARKPVPTVSLAGRTLNQGSEYTVSYLNNVAIGTATCVVTGTGNWKGRATASFKIVGKAGWVDDGPTRYYFSDDKGKKATGWVALSGKRYYLDTTTGAMKTGWMVVSGVTYYLGTDGVARTGWQTISGKTYYFDATTGAMKTGWVKVGGKQYYLGTNGVKCTGWVKVKGKRYYLGSNGVKRTGWVKVNGKRYYLGSNGAARTGWKKIKGKTYYFNATTGAMRTGWLKLKGKRYYLGSNGVKRTGWVKVKGKRYYLGKNGVARTGKKTIKGKTYYFNAKTGAARTGWVKLKGKYYYFDKKTAAMAKSKWIGKYHVNSKGVRDKKR